MTNVQGTTVLLPIIGVGVLAMLHQRTVLDRVNQQVRDLERKDRGGKESKVKQFA